MYQDAARLEQAETIDALWAGVVAGLRKHGIHHVIYISATGTPAHDTRVLSTCPELYSDAHPDDDPFLAHCCNSYDITPTGAEFLPDHSYLDAQDKAFISKARAHGFLSGFGIPTRLRGGARYGGFNLGTTLDRAAFMDSMWPRAEQFRLFCLLVHRRIEELSGRVTGPEPAMIAPNLPPRLDTLSPRETEVIYLLARGLSRKEAARTCGISQHTIAEYAKSAYRKLGVRNRAEAARLIYGAVQGT
ncbi:LuxR family transcriptional regulator [uncultured Tateyamaria sp.]|uniref:helix-turn-helix transcriptional regulator n=1 Tax=uncultured Tateyamaria sp. TaxID=455651 RepID=UPI00261E7D31|nr:LuxR family transcriptional regulator [uncultured Tateyamaria sp.]